MLVVTVTGGEMRPFYPRIRAIGPFRGRKLGQVLDIVGG